MPFYYHDIKNSKPLEDEVFLFDANVWIFYHDQTNAPYYAKPYNRFLNELLKGSKDPVVILPAAVLSEVINRLMKDVYFPEFLKSKTGKEQIAIATVSPDEYYKEVYRPHLQYKRDRDNIYNRIFSYTTNLRLVADQFNEVTYDDLTTAMTDLDFTDWIICQLAEINDHATIITDDRDFVLENYPIITNNKKLLGLMPPPASSHKVP